MPDKRKKPLAIPKPARVTPVDPESLFRDLKRRSSTVQYLWAHQADLLRAYHADHLNAPDLALELPAGSGKTLVGLLIGEYRRRARNERVVYLCPTRQLANQVGTQAESYGIGARVLVGPQAEYDPAAFAEYAQGKAIAVTTYSGLFNTKPRIRDPHAIILDDSHAGEGYIASMWSLEVSRALYPGLYHSVVDLFADRLPAAFSAELREDQPDPLAKPVDKVPQPYFWDRLQAVRDVLEHGIPPESALRYQLSVLGDHLFACNLFMSWGSLLLRPLIPPALTHAPFAEANQRLYMSATLGEGGELERVTGVRRIERLPAPPGWDRQGIGRRFFVLPNMSLKPAEAFNFVFRAVEMVHRALVLSPSASVAQKFVDEMRTRGYSGGVLGAADIEASLDPFVSERDVVLVLTNRYDGLDLPGDSCRLSVLTGLPGATNLQESFLLRRLGAHALLRDRIRTRLLQGAGRCTRSAADFAAVVLLGSDLSDFCAKVEVRSAMHPEIQAELEFGLSNSEADNTDDLVDRLEQFFTQAAEWKRAEEAIVEAREGKTRVPDAAAVGLRAVVSREVDYAYAMWREDAAQAFEAARDVADDLGGQNLRPYRAWWYYLAASLAALLGARGTAGARESSRELFKRAATTAVGVSWLANLGDGRFGGEPVPEADPLLAEAVEGVADELQRVGGTGKRFERDMQSFMDLVTSDDPDRFDGGLKRMGELLGWSAERPSGDGAPDSIWSLPGRVMLVLEGKSSVTPGDPITIQKCRQTAGHLAWAAHNRPSGPGERRSVTMVTPRSRISRDALPHTGESCYVHIGDLRRLARELVSVLRQARVQAGLAPEETLKQVIAEKFLAARLDPEAVAAALGARRLRDLPS